MTIRNDASSLIFFAYRVGRPMTEDGSLHKSNIYAEFKPFYSSTGKEADNQKKKLRCLDFSSPPRPWLIFFAIPVFFFFDR